MEVRFFLCAESAVVDSTSNKMTILNVVEELSAVGFPAVMPLLTMVTLLSRKKAEADKPHMNIICTQNNKPIFNVPIEPEFQSKLRTRTIVGVQGVVLPGPGTLTVTLIHKKKSIAAWPIEVLDASSAPMTVRPQPAVASGTTSAPKHPRIPRRRHR